MEEPQVATGAPLFAAPQALRTPSRLVPATAFPPFACAAVLLIASALKAYQLATDPALGILYGSRWLQAGLVEYELLLALWLLSGFGASWARRVALVTFLTFAGYSLYLGLSGTASCGCFGKVRVNPWWTFTLDAALAFSLLLRNVSPSALQPIRFTRVLASAAVPATLVLTGILVVALALWRPRSATPDSSFADSSFVLLEPEKWIGKPFPLTEYIDMAGSERLSRGSWIVLFYHEDCPKCQKAISLYEQLAEDLSRAGERAQVALITVPPIRSGELTSCPHCHLGRLRDSKEWLITTPANVRLIDGQVTAATSNDESLGAELHSGTHQR